jgi:hypothetical protein
MFTHKDRKVLHEIRDEQKEIVHLLKLIYDLLRPMAAEQFKISQEGFTMITGVPAGGTGTFTESPVPVGGLLQPGNVPVWTVDDALVSLTPSADGTSANVAVGASDTATSFNLTVSGVNSAGAPISTTVNVPILPAVAVPATGFDIEQTA